MNNTKVMLFFRSSDQDHQVPVCALTVPVSTNIVAYSCRQPFPFPAFRDWLRDTRVICAPLSVTIHSIPVKTLSVEPYILFFQSLSPINPSIHRRHIHHRIHNKKVPSLTK